MKGDVEESEMTTTETTVAQPTMIESIATLLQTLVGASKAKGTAKVNLGRWDVSKGYPDPIYDATAPDTSVTPKQAKATLARFCKAVVSSGWKPASALTPSTHGMQLTHPLTSGKNKGTKVPVFAYGLSKVRRDARRTLKSEKRSVALAAAQENGGAWFAEGVTDKAGVGVAYVSEVKARKASARAVHGADWWTTDKASRLQEAVVYQGTYVEVGESTLTSDVVLSTDDAIIAAAQQLGSKASTVRGAKTFMLNLAKK
tara:strand:+ start:151 stop:924 length:774 start_codon:yes stop_codon:yes gene_type:complete